MKKLEIFQSPLANFNQFLICDPLFKDTPSRTKVKGFFHRLFSELKIGYNSLMALNLASKMATKAVFNEYGIHPSKRLGQNFLIDKFAVKKVVLAAELTKKDTVLEVGPGIGSLTQGLAPKAKKVIAVEKDLKMARILNDELAIKNIKNVEIIESDILKIPDSKFIIYNLYKVVANLPFYLTAPVIRKFLESKFPPKEMILIIQKEVAQRICAKPPKMSLLAMAVQFYAKPEIISYLSKKSFWPEPKVDSAIIKIYKIGDRKFGIDRDLFFKVVKAGFSQPRKMLVNNLVKKLLNTKCYRERSDRFRIDKEGVKKILQKNHINPSQRPETLNLKDWENIAKEFSTLLLL